MVLTDFYFSCSRNAVAQCSCNNVYDSEKCRTNLHVTQGTFMGLMCSLVKTFRLMLREFWCFTLWRIHELQEREKKNELLDRDKQIERERDKYRKKKTKKESLQDQHSNLILHIGNTTVFALSLSSFFLFSSAE